MMALFLYFSLFLLHTCTSAADCISRFPFGLGQLSTGLVPLGVIAPSEDVLIYFLEESSSLIFLNFVIAGYIKVEA